MFKALVVVLFLSLASLTIPSAHALGLGDQLGLSPHWNWKTIETKHFRVSFPEELTETAQKSATILEEAHAILSPRLFWEPSYRPQVLVIDNADSANGMTSPILRFGMVLLVTPPENWFSTSYYDDWLRLLIIHEYTHFLNMDPTKSFWTPLRYIFGDVLLPNAAWESWMLEGLAVYMETSHTRSGRGRSPYYEAILRSAVQEDVLDTSRFITLDKLQGPDPYFPGGETPYLFGYELMNQVARHGEDALGQLSIRSAGRVPYFVNGNLDKVIGKTWYVIWNEWVADTRVRATKQLTRIRSQPVSTISEITDRTFEVLGSAVSPDNRFIAFTAETLEKRMGLYVRDLKSGQVKWLTDKLLGAKISFTPDSRSIIFSALHRTSLYTEFSDLAVYDLASGHWDWLTDHLRARDPSFSSDGKWVTFTIANRSATELAIAPLEKNSNGDLRIGTVQKLFTPNSLDRVSTPIFFDQDRKIVFSLHRNGTPSEEIVEYDRVTGKMRELVSDGHFNRFPTLAPDNQLYYVSDLTRVDNLYRYRADRAADLVTNLTTGMYFPCFAPDGTLYGSVLKYDGWKLARVQRVRADPQSLLLDPPPAPASTPAPTLAPQLYPVQDYSVIPSIWPRQWAPFFALDAQSVYFGGEVLGYDATDRHRYLLLLAYDTLIDKPTLLAQYTNRSLGPSLTLRAEKSTDSIFETRPVLDYARRTRWDLSISQPILWTYSSLTPSVSFKADRVVEIRDKDVVYDYPYVPIVNGLLSYTNAEVSRLAIMPEAGRDLTLGAQAYLDSGYENWKALLVGKEYLSFPGHNVLVPSFKASWVTRTNPNYLPANVLVQGRFRRLTDTLPDDNFDQLSIRGYPRRPFYVHAAAVGALDYFVPLSRIYRGNGTAPYFFKNFYGFTFAEAAYFPQENLPVRALPATGVGLRLTTQVFTQIPTSFTLEYDYGFRSAYGGVGELFFELSVPGIQF